MSKDGKKRIGIWFGGCSPEYDVSLASASAVISHINYEKYNVVLIGIDRKGNWYLYEGGLEGIQTDTWLASEKVTPAAVTWNSHIDKGREEEKVQQQLLVFRPEGMETIRLDGALPILHGKNGEDGTLQGLLELAGIPILGCDTLSSALCMDKDRAHRLVQHAGVKVPEAFTFSLIKNTTDYEKIFEKMMAEEVLPAAAKLGYPLFVKPVRAGSSFGISRVMSADELEDALRKALQYDGNIILEEAVRGFEVGCAVLGIQELFLGEVDEIELSEGFFDYTEKYTLKTSSIHVPARIPAETAERIKDTAKIIYKTLGCTYFARVDMFLTEEGEIYFNEVNTIPGFTSHSRYPNMMKAAGLSFFQLLERILDMGLADRDIGYGVS